MSLITCCPACGTMFKVVPDQLRISEGWVRCGHCAEVFDASAHLQGPTAPAPLPTPEPVAEPVPEPAPVAERIGTEEPAPAADRPDADSGYPPFEFVRADLSDQQEAAQEDLPLDSRPSSEALKPASTVDDEPQADSQLDDLGFVREARRKAFWRRGGVRAFLALAALGLAVLLPLQYAVHERDRLVVQQPSWRPLLEMLCMPLACTLGPPRQIEAIVIDSSTFNRLRSDAYRLSFTLKNQGATEVAMPAVELTLTDTQDQPVVRRVLTPREMGSTSAVIPAASDWSANLALSVSANGGMGRVAGYRLLAFYP